MRGAGGFPGVSGAEGQRGTGAQAPGAGLADTFVPNDNSLMMSIAMAQASVFA